MGYRVKKGVALFHMCGTWYLFPSKAAGGLLSAILSVPEEGAQILQRNKEEPDREDEIIRPETAAKLKKLCAAGYIEEY